MRRAVAGSGGCPGAAAMLLYRCPSAGRGNEPEPAGGPGAVSRPGLAWAGLERPLGAAGGAGGWHGAEAEQRSRLGRAGVRADAGPERGWRAATLWLPVPEASVRPEAGGQRCAGAPAPAL